MKEQEQNESTDAADGKPVVIERSATANWQGNLKEGEGNLGTESEVLHRVPYRYDTRFEPEQKGTNPEELLAAAHAGCFTMSVAAILGKKGFEATSLHTKGTVTLEGLEITKIHVSITGFINDITADEFREITKEAAKNCVMSKALKVPVTSESHLAT